MAKLSENLAPFLISRVHTVEIGGTSVLARRVAGSGMGTDQTPIPPIEQTSVACVQLAPIACQSLWKLGKLYGDEPYSESSIEIIYLAEEPQSLVPVSFDCFHLEVPDAALQAVADAQHQKNPGLLRCRKGEIDFTMHNLATALLPTLAKPQKELRNSERLFVDQIVFAMISHLSSRYGTRQLKAVAAGRLAPRQLRLVTERMLADFRHEPSLGEIAGLADLPVSRFVEVFRQTTGMTPARYMRHIRIEAAKEMLFRTALPLKDIAHRCGFADHSHFTRVFVAQVGVPPATWRRER